MERSSSRSFYPIVEIGVGIVVPSGLLMFVAHVTEWAASPVFRIKPRVDHSGRDQRCARWEYPTIAIEFLASGREGPPDDGVGSPILLIAAWGSLTARSSPAEARGRSPTHLHPMRSR